MSIREIVANHDKGMFASGPSFLLKFTEFLFVLSNFIFFFFSIHIRLILPLRTKKQPQKVHLRVSFQALTYVVRPLSDQCLLRVERPPPSVRLSVRRLLALYLRSLPLVDSATRIKH